MNSELAKKVFANLFVVDDAIINRVNVIMVNLTSLLSPLFYIELNRELVKENSYYVLIQSLIDIFKAQMIERYASKRLVFYYKDIYKPYIIRELYPNWRVINGKDEKAIYGVKTYDILHNTITQLAKIGQVTQIVSEEEDHIWKAREYISNLGDTQVLIISRDPMDMLNAVYKNVTVWNGRYPYSYDIVRKPDKKVLEFGNTSPIGMSWVLLLAGAPSKIGYSGIFRFGVKKAIDFIVNNTEVLLMEADEILASEKYSDAIKSVIPYRPLFFYRDYVIWYNNRKIQK